MTTRRAFLKQMQAAGLAAMAASLPTASFLSGCRPERRLPATADSVILLWMAGGMAYGNQFAYYIPNKAGTGTWFPATQIGYGLVTWDAKTGDLHYEIYKTMLQTYTVP